MKKKLFNPGWLRQYTCPKCGRHKDDVPAHLPWCDNCGSKIRMLPSHCGVIVADYRAVRRRERRLVARLKRECGLVPPPSKPRPKPVTELPTPAAAVNHSPQGLLRYKELQEAANRATANRA